MSRIPVVGLLVALASTAVGGPLDPPQQPPVQLQPGYNAFLMNLQTGVTAFMNAAQLIASGFAPPGYDGRHDTHAGIYDAYRANLGNDPSVLRGGGVFVQQTLGRSQVWLNIRNSWLSVFANRNSAAGSDGVPPKEVPGIMEQLQRVIGRDGVVRYARPDRNKFPVTVPDGRTTMPLSEWARTYLPRMLEGTRLARMVRDTLGSPRVAAGATAAAGGAALLIPGAAEVMQGAQMMQPALMQGQLLAQRVLPWIGRLARTGGPFAVFAATVYAGASVNQGIADRALANYAAIERANGEGEINAFVLGEAQWRVLGPMLHPSDRSALAQVLAKTPRMREYRLYGEVYRQVYQQLTPTQRSVLQARVQAEYDAILAKLRRNRLCP